MSEVGNVSLDESLLTYAKTRDPKLRAVIIEAHLPLVERLARRFANRGESFEDLVQAGSIGLIKSVDRYDPELGYEFVAYATTTVLGELKRHFRDHGWSIRASRRVQELYLELGRTIEVLSQRLGRSPNVREMAAEMGATEDAVLEAMEAGFGYRSPSLDAPSPEGGFLGDRVGGEDRNFELIESRVTIIPQLSVLPERERRLIEMRFVEELSQVEIAKRLGISQMHVSRLLARSIAALHRAVEDPQNTTRSRAGGDVPAPRHGGAPDGEG
jgi:RNA polymerase sigma-B factor